MSPREVFIHIQTRDPLVVRDTRAFGPQAGNRMRALGWPYPSLLAGAVRTLAGSRIGEFDPPRLRQIGVRGPLLQSGPGLCFPVPGDLTVIQGSVKALRPLRLQPGEGVDLPLLGPQGQRLLPAGLPRREGKPDKIQAFLRESAMIAWLADESIALAGSFHAGPELETRTHVSVDPTRNAALEGMLFSSAGLQMRDSDGIALHVRDFGPADRVFRDGLQFQRCLHHVGGERRLAYWDVVPGASGWTCPGRVRQKLQAVRPGGGLRMVLATPALWKGGWLPEWLASGEGIVPGTSVKVKLVSVCQERWRPVAGWSYEAASFGPKALRRLVAAGATYFLELLSGQASELASLWLTPVGDGAETTQAQLDGFGLALWGVWTANG